MYNASCLINQQLLEAYQTTGLSMRYSLFTPRLYNLVCSLGFRPGKIMPSRAFCSDESQGYPIILITKHFGTFPFNHGRVGGIVATDRHAPHAHHGEDLVIIQASHVGYDPKSKSFGKYRRLQTKNSTETTNCGKICGILDWYQSEYIFASKNIYLLEENNDKKVIIDNQLLHQDREEGLILNQKKLIQTNNDGAPITNAALSTAKIFLASTELIKALGADTWPKNKREPIGKRLPPNTFFYRRNISKLYEGSDHLEKNLLEIMPYIVTSDKPALTAAQANSQVEFDRAFRTIVQEPSYDGKNIFFISGLNIDISPQDEQIFPLTKFLPWAAFVRDKNGHQQTWEQQKLYDQLIAQSTENPDKIDLELAISMMEKEQEVLLPF